MDISSAIHRELIRPAARDVCGTAGVYTQPGTLRTVENTVHAPTDGVRCDGWWADRCRVDLFGVASDAGATLRLRLINCNADDISDGVIVIDRGIVIPANSKAQPLKLSLGIASGWLAQYWVLTAAVLNPGESCEFQARYLLDRGAAGLYAAFGDGTVI